jgi:hypothetical protein
VLATAACTSNKSNDSAAKANLSKPCTALRADDAKSLLHAGSVRKVSFKTLLEEELSQPTETTTADAAGQIAAADASTCSYRTGGASSPTVSYQYGFVVPSFFPTVDKFIEANKHTGDEEVTGVGRAAVYGRVPDSHGTKFVVLLDGGNNFVIKTENAQPSRAAVASLAKAIIGRLPRLTTPTYKVP